MKLQIAGQETPPEKTITLSLSGGPDGVYLNAENSDGLNQIILQVTPDGDISIVGWISPELGLNINEAGKINVIR